jgi:hypothetical protein
MTLGSLALERSDFAPLGNQSVVGYLNGTHILPVVWLAVVPGILGHQVRATLLWSSVLHGKPYGSLY